jgi:hypothetical protein
VSGPAVLEPALHDVCCPMVSIRGLEMPARLSTEERLQRLVDKTRKRVDDNPEATRFYRVTFELSEAK